MITKNYTLFILTGFMHFIKASEITDTSNQASLFIEQIRPNERRVRFSDENEYIEPNVPKFFYNNSEIILSKRKDYFKLCLSKIKLPFDFKLPLKDFSFEEGFLYEIVQKNKAL